MFRWWNPILFPRSTLDTRQKDVAKTTAGTNVDPMRLTNFAYTIVPDTYFPKSGQRSVLSLHADSRTSFQTFPPSCFLHGIQKKSDKEGEEEAAAAMLKAIGAWALAAAVVLTHLLK